MIPVPCPSLAGFVLKLLFVEPFYGGSHRSFIESWQQHSRHRFDLIQLPPYKWKWRMRHAGLSCAQQANQAEGDFDLIICSDMLPLAEFKGLLNPALQNCPTVCYFHENQLTYPTSKGTVAERDFHFVYTNFMNLVTANESWFNSQFHLDSFTGELEQHLQRFPDFQHLEEFQASCNRCFVQHPGIEIPTTVTTKADCDSPLTIVWPHRWEYDKNPEQFFRVLNRLKSQLDFRIIVLGESFRNSPAIFQQARLDFADQIQHWGFVESRQRFQSLLAAEDVAVSTANHEFFGIAMLECAASHALPLVPNRLAYPETIEHNLHPDCFYDGTDDHLAQRLVELHNDRSHLAKLAGQVAKHTAQRFSWELRAREMDDRLEELLNKVNTGS